MEKFATGMVYFEQIRRILDRVIESQRQVMDDVAGLWARAIADGRVIFVFGCTHAGIISEELFYRAGGLVPVNPVFHPAMVSSVRPVTLTSRCERLTGLGQELAAETPFVAGDILLIHSVSGRNPAPIDLAIAAGQRGVVTVALTNRAYSDSQPSRHPSGRRLWEVCDYCLDNCGDFADAAVSLPGLDQKVSPTSTVIGAAIVNAIVAETCAKLQALGVKPPVFRSANAEGGDAINRELMDRYRSRLTYI
ncbi:MAG: SIS domain-containing protein [Negativicutes bacterium]|nr:SIS domain-containing protein [Negativicutes bacterium]